MVISPFWEQVAVARVDGEPVLYVAEKDTARVTKWPLNASLQPMGLGEQVTEAPGPERRVLEFCQ